MSVKKLWINRDININEAKSLAKSAGISIFLAKIFLSRGIKDSDYIKSFLNPELSSLYDPYLLKDMDKAVNRIIQAIELSQKILIFGDYDVDGITSTSILYDFLSSISPNVDYYIPNRINDGYGLSIPTIDRLLARNPELIITVDCGITALDEVKYLSDKNIDIIITDHHELSKEIPAAYAVVNPCRNDCTYPFERLAGVGVVFKLIDALSQRLGQHNAHLKYLDLVAVGTIADVVPLIDENRIIVKHGLKSIPNTDNIGLKALLAETNLIGRPITSWSIGFVIAPKINAAGRIDNAEAAVKLFTTKDEFEAKSIALELIKKNKYRQELEAEIYTQVVDIIEANPRYKIEKILVVSGENWHSGIIGIVASKICEKYYKPCILINNENGVGKASARSIEGFNIFNAILHCNLLLTKYGGHELAAGLSIPMQNVEEFTKKINAYADQVLTEPDMTRKINIDLEIIENDLSKKNLQDIEKLAPFGSYNNVPLFLFKNLTIKEIKAMSENQHLKLILDKNFFLTEAIGFNMGDRLNELLPGEIIDIICLLEINRWNNTEKLQLKLKDFKKLKKEEIYGF